MPARSLAWGRKVSSEFRLLVLDLCLRQKMDPDYLMACMAFESGETFRPDVKNAAGSGATGLIQFMPRTARDLGTTTEALAAMSAEDQLLWVERYFKPFKGRLKTLADHYMAILLPSMVGKPESSVLFSAGKPYRQNAGLDTNRDGKVTKAEASAKVQAKLVRGMSPAHRYVPPDFSNVAGGSDTVPDA